MKRLHIPNIDNVPAASRVFERGKRYLDGSLLKVPYTTDLHKINDGVEKDHSIGLDCEWCPDTGKVHSVGLSSFDYAGGFPLDEVIEYVRSVFSNPYIQVVGHNIVADVVKAIDFLGVPIRCKFLDTLILKRELAFSEYTRAEESLEFFSYYALFTEDFKYTNDPEFFKKPSKELFYRTAGDAWTGLILADWFYNKYKDHWNSMQRAMELDMQMIVPVAYMIHDGITVDLEAIKKHQDILDEDAIKLMGTIQDTYGINPGSAAQVKEKLHELGFKVDGTGVGILSEIDHPLAELILKYRKTTKLSSSFLTNLPNMMDSGNRVHPHLAISGAVTGRLTSTKPAIQTIPPEVRDIYMSNFGDDGVLIDVDASQSEFRCLGYLANSRPIIQAYEKGTDFHSLSAELAGISRKDAKTLNFAYIYGASKDKLKEELIKSGVDINSTYSILNKYMMIMSNLGINKYQKYILNSTYNKGYVESPNGRRGDRVKKQQAVNFPIQSFSSDLNKKRIIELANIFQSEGMVSRVWCEFHDAACLDVYLPELDRVKEIIHNLDQQIPDVLGIGVNMDLPIDMKIHGRNWS